MLPKTYFGLITLTLITIMVHLMGINLYGKAKTSEMVTVICGIKNVHFLATNFLFFLAFRVTSKTLGIGAAEHSWGDVKTIKSRKYICY